MAPALAAAVVVVACREPTQVTLELSTDVPCGDVGGTAIAVGRPERLEDRHPSASTRTCARETGRIGSLVIVPSGDRDVRFGVRVVLGVGKSPEECVADGLVGGCVVARRSLAYVPHASLRLPVTLDRDCLDVPCDAEHTCVRGACVSAEVDLASCSRPDGCRVVPADAGPEGAGGSGGGAGGASGTEGGADASRPDGAGGAAGGAAGTGGRVDASAGTGGAAGAPDASPDGSGLVDAADGGGAGGAAGAPTDAGCAVPPCVPTVFWTATGAKPTRLAQDSTSIYVADSGLGGILRIPKAGGPMTTLASGQMPRRVAVTATHAYWTETVAKKIRRVPLAGGAVEDVLTTPSPHALVLDAARLFFTDQSAAGSVQEVPIAGGSPAVLVGGETWPNEIAVDATHVYWTQFTNAGSVRRVPIGGGPPEILDAGVSNSIDIALTATHAFYTAVGNGIAKGEVVRVPLAGGPRLVLAASQRGPRGIAVVDGDVYFTNSDEGTMKRVAADGSSASPTVLYAAGAEPLGIVADATAVYWADDRTGTVMRVGR